VTNSERALVSKEEDGGRGRSGRRKGRKKKEKRRKNKMFLCLKS